MKARPWVVKIYFTLTFILLIRLMLHINFSPFVLFLLSENNKNKRSWFFFWFSDFHINLCSLSLLSIEDICLRCPWVSISRTWLKIEALATFRLRNRRRIAFWLDPWKGESTLHLTFPQLFKITLLPNGSVADHGGSALSSWSSIFHQLLKDEEISEFQVEVS